MIKQIGKQILKKNLEDYLLEINKIIIQFMLLEKYLKKNFNIRVDS